MVVQVVEFSSGGVQNWKDFCVKINIPKRKLLNLENWCNGEVSKIGHHFRKYGDLKIDFNQKCAPKLIFFNE